MAFYVKKRGGLQSCFVLNKYAGNGKGTRGRKRMGQLFLLSLGKQKMVNMKSKGAAILAAKCPRCHQGNMFPVSMVSFKKLSVVNSHCPHCNASLEPEPDFYYGAMYISYALSVALVINVMIILNFVFDDPEDRKSVV